MQLSMLSRLPEENDKKGDNLFEEAWKDHDVAMMLADWYKTCCQVMYTLQLATGWVTICISSWSSEILTELDWLPESVLEHGIFVCALFASALIALEAMLKPRSRWRQLRARACMMSKTIWCYRARVSEFHMAHGTISAEPEARLREAIDAWRQSVVKSASLADTTFERKCRQTIYKHKREDGDKQNKSSVLLSSRTTKVHKIADSEGPRLLYAAHSPIRFLELMVAGTVLEDQMPTFLWGSP